MKLDFEPKTFTRGISRSLFALALVSTSCGDGPSEVHVTDFELIAAYGDRQQGCAFADLPYPVTVLARGGLGTKVAGQTVDFHVLQGGGSVRHGTATTDTAGFAAQHWTLGGPGPQILEARATTRSGKKVIARFTATAHATADGRAITTDPHDQLYPAISGDRIVWLDTRAGRYDIYLYDLARETERRITADTSGRWGPAISGQRIIWRDYRDGRTDVYVYDLATETARRLTTDPNVEVSSDEPAISGDYIVWIERGDTPGSAITLYDVADGMQHRLTTTPQGARRAAISGDRVVWTDLRDYPDDNIYLFDLVTQTERAITTDPNPQFEPAISGDHIVWEDWRNPTGEYIYLYDLGTDTERPILTAGSSVNPPVISGDYVAWLDYGDGTTDIYVYDLTTNSQRHVTWTNGGEFLAISGTRIVWEDGRSGNLDIYLYDLADPVVTPCSPPGGS